MFWYCSFIRIIHVIVNDNNTIYTRKLFFDLFFRRYGIEIKDFGKSWRDGLAFNAIVHTIRPDLVDMDNVKKQSARVNLENAFSTAENHLGIARLIDPEGNDH